MRLAAAGPEDMRALGARLAAAVTAAGLRGPLVVGLSGDLGAGKTTLVSGFLAELGYEGAVRSPSYTLVEPYRLAGRDVYHCDLYRLRDPAEFEDLGLRELLVDRCVLLVEWPERAADRLRTIDLLLRLGYADDGRLIELEAASEPGRRILQGLSLDHA